MISVDFMYHVLYSYACMLSDQPWTKVYWTYLKKYIIQSKFNI